MADTGIAHDYSEGIQPLGCGGGYHPNASRRRTEWLRRRRVGVWARVWHACAMGTEWVDGRCIGPAYWELCTHLAGPSGTSACAIVWEIHGRIARPNCD